ncbi:MAG: hypothetical protein EON49_11445 [Acidovorax sp.]|nr:MAG: hypothetical protein EON49_11445 [Acidovorax sp.]
MEPRASAPEGGRTRWPGGAGSTGALACAAPVSQHGAQGRRQKKNPGRVLRAGISFLVSGHAGCLACWMIFSRLQAWCCPW